MEKLGTTDPREVAAAVLYIITVSPHLHEQGHWIDVRPDLGYLTVGKIRADPSACDATACAASWTVLLTAPDEAIPHYETLEFADGTRQFIAYLAREALYLSEREANWLFHGTRSRAELLAGLQAIAAGKPVHVPSDWISPADDCFRAQG